jgi:hypothetical protein
MEELVVQLLVKAKGTNMIDEFTEGSRQAVMFYHCNYDTDAYFSFHPFLPHLPTPLIHPSVRTALTLCLLLILGP